MNMNKYRNKPIHWLLILMLLGTTSFSEAQCLENKVHSFSIGERVDYITKRKKTISFYQ